MPAPRKRLHPAQAGGRARARFIQNCMNAARERAVKASLKRWKFLSGNADIMGGREPPPISLPRVSIQHIGDPAPGGYVYREVTA